MENYREFLENHKEILNFIIDNNLNKKIYKANLEAKKLANGGSKNFLHSYRWAKIYDVIKENNLNKENISSILDLLENPFNKNIDGLLKDFSSINENKSDYEM